jgi:hypothetical protein
MNREIDRWRRESEERIREERKRREIEIDE